MLVTIIDVENGKHTVQEITDALNARFQQIKARNPRGYLDQFEQQAGTIMLEIAQEKGIAWRSATRTARRTTSSTTRPTTT